MSIWKRIIKTISQIQRNKTTDKLREELLAQEMVFTMLVLGNVAGIALPSNLVSLSLLPLMEDELIALFARLATMEGSCADAGVLFD
jgi:uncharacterized membrane protein